MVVLGSAWRHEPIGRHHRRGGAQRRKRPSSSPSRPVCVGEGREITAAPRAVPHSLRRYAAFVTCSLVVATHDRVALWFVTSGAAVTDPVAALSWIVTPAKRDAQGGSHMGNHVLEPATQEFADAAAIPPYLYELEPDQARK